MRKSAASSYVCRTCLSRGLQSKASVTRTPSSVNGSRSFGVKSVSALRPQRAHSAGRRDFATLQDTPRPVNGIGVPSIRKRLRQWEIENKASTPRLLPTDEAESGMTRNVLTRPRNLAELALGDEEGISGLDQPLPDSDGSLDLLPPPSDFRPGDLVELQELGDRLATVAICLGHINGCYHLYTTLGKWIPLKTLSMRFVARNFIDEKELQPLIDKLPKEKLSYQTLKEMAALKMGPDRVTGGDVLSKMMKFQQRTDEVMQKFAARFEKAHETLVAQDSKRYLTLEQIAARLVTGETRTDPIPMHTLYAVHRTIATDDVGFRLAGRLGNTRTWLFEVTPPEDAALIRNMQALVRLFTDIPEKADIPLSSLTPSLLTQSRLGGFILRARNEIDESRRFREWTPHGMLGPAKKPRPLAGTRWKDVDTSILHFMYLWAGYDQFPSFSPFHWIGSAILRATGRYKDSEYLSTTTGWTFLQEVGYLTPWDIHARHVQRLPEVQASRESGFERMTLGPQGVKPYLTPDIFHDKRKDWADLRAFAVDSEDTVDVDDALSVEATEAPGEHWIHVHVADPASRIRHQCALGERAELTPMTLYLSGHYSNIWGVGDEVQRLFSLAPNKPCLTFSGKINEHGELLDYKIIPAKLQQFVYMTPEEANVAVGVDESRRPPTWASVERFTVGKPPAGKPTNRKMTASSELRPKDLESLRTLHRLAQALREKRIAKGAMPVYPLQPSVKASFENTSVEKTPTGMMTCNGDPSISVSWADAESSMVTSTMMLAGEIAAKWCADRNIPIPYISQPLAEKNLDMVKSYTQKTYYPLVLRGEHTREHWPQLRTLLGPDEMTTRPGPHFLMGVDCYAKVTSPLRRYSDLLAHWQIESALVQEMETGKVAEQKLPFSRDELDRDIFPWLQLRQRVLRGLGSREGNRAYMLQALVRAWKFTEEDDSRLPETFRFTVMAVSRVSLRAVFGSLDWFGLDAVMVSEGLGTLGVRVADIRQGDVFEVRLVDVNVYIGDVFVEAVGKLAPELQDDPEGPAVGAGEGEAHVGAETV